MLASTCTAAGRIFGHICANPMQFPQARQWCREAAMLGAGLGAPRYGPFGPPFSDPKLQATYDAEWRKLSSSILITDGVARDLVATVINSALAAGESSVPKIERRVKVAVREEIPTIEAEVESTVKGILIGAGAVVALLGVGYGIYKAAT